MKFRAYDKQEKKYVDLKNNPLWMDNEGDFYFISDLPCCSCEGMSFYSDRYVVEFSTGLKDKNGVEIYEGDILGGCNGSINGHGITEKWKVYWSKARAEFQMPLWVYDKDGEYSYGDSTHWFEIIGNIHDGEADDKD